MRRHSSPIALWLVAFSVMAAVAGCQSTHDDLLARGYPPAYADGYKDGCGSGRQAAGSMNSFNKDVPRYTSEAFYSGGWDDGFKQCQAQLLNTQKQQFDQHFWSDRDRNWDQQKAQGEAKAFKSR